MEPVLTNMEPAGSLGGDLISGARMCMQQLFTRLSSVAEAAYRNTQDGQPDAPAGHQPEEESSIRSLLRRNAVPPQKVSVFPRRQCKGDGHVTTPAQNLTPSVHCGQGKSSMFWVDQLALAYPPEPLNWMRFSRPQVCTSLLSRSDEPKVTGSCVILTTIYKPVPTSTGSTARRCGFPTFSRNLSRNVFPLQQYIGPDNRCPSPSHSVWFR